MELISPGHYARKQLLSPSALVGWSHGTRFRIARFGGVPGTTFLTTDRLADPSHQSRYDFLIGRRLFSPLPIMGLWLNSQVWFVCRKK